MIHTKSFYILFILMITAAGTGCKKDKQGGSLTQQKKVIVTTIAGDGTDAYANGAALSAKFDAPVDVAVAADETIYVADYNNHRIRKIANGQVSTLAGNNTFGIVNGNGELAQYKNPYRIALDAAGNLYTLDMVDPRIRKISPTADVTTYAGTDMSGFLNGAALTAQFAVNALGLASDPQGNIYIDDTFNERIRQISTAGQVTTFSGSGTEGLRDGDKGTAQFRFPAGIALDIHRNLFVADAANLCIRKITPDGTVSRFAGSGTRGNADGNPDVAQFNIMEDIVVDNDGNLYVTDDNRIRKISPQGIVSTIAGSTAGFADGDGATAKFKDPVGLGIDAHGNIYVADGNNNRIRKISFQ